MAQNRNELVNETLAYLFNQLSSDAIDYRNPDIDKVMTVVFNCFNVVSELRNALNLMDKLQDYGK